MDSDPFLGNGGYGVDQAWQCDVQTLGAQACLDQAEDYLVGFPVLGPGWSQDQSLVLEAEFLAGYSTDWPRVALFGNDKGDADMVGCPSEPESGIMGGSKVRL